MLRTIIAAILVAVCAVSPAQDAKVTYKRPKGTMPKVELFERLQQSREEQLEKLTTDIRRLELAIADASPLPKSRTVPRRKKDEEPKPVERSPSCYGPLRGGLEAPIKHEEIPAAKLALKQAAGERAKLKTAKLIVPELDLKDIQHYTSSVCYLVEQKTNDKGQRVSSPLILTVSQDYDGEKRLVATSTNNVVWWIEQNSDDTYKSGDVLILDMPVRLSGFGYTKKQTLAEQYPEFVELRIFAD